MVRLWIISLSTVLTIGLASSETLAQSRTQSSRTQSSRTTGASGGATAGTAIGGMAETFGENVPPIQQGAQALRGGGTFGAETQILGATGEAGAAGGTRGTRGTQGVRRGTSLRSPTQPGQRRGAAASTAVPVTLTLGFAHTVAVPSNVGGELSACLARLPSFPKDGSVRARVEQNVVVLEGTVATAHDRALAMQMVALQPGVHKIDNRLEVKPATP